MDKQIVFTSKNNAEFLPDEVKKPAPYEIRVKTAFSTISNGTEKANITGCVSAGDDVNVPQYPKILGYSTSGVVEELGDEVSQFSVGDRVAMYWSTHRNYNVINEKNAVKVPDNVSLREAALAHIATFPLAAIRKTRLEIGETVMVMGLGTLGLIAVNLASVAGAGCVIAVDPVENRRNKALEFGADYAFNPFEEDFATKIKEITNGGVNVAIEVTGQGAGLDETLDCMAKFGRIALLGCTRNSDFSIDYYKKIHFPGITLVGAHTLARPELESHQGWYTVSDDMKTILNLCSKKRLNLENMIEETHSPCECKKVYDRLVNDKNFPTVVQFKWD